MIPNAFWVEQTVDTGTGFNVLITVVFCTYFDNHLKGSLAQGHNKRTCRPIFTLFL